MRCANQTCDNYSIASTTLCETCRASLTQPQPAAWPLAQGKRNVTTYRNLAGTKRSLEDDDGLPVRPSPLKRSRSQLALSNEPSTATQIHLPILFVPFEGKFNQVMLSGYATKGNQVSTLVEGSGGGPVIQRGEKTLTQSNQPSDFGMASTYGAGKFWTAKGGTHDKKALFAQNRSDLTAKLTALGLSNSDFYEIVVADRLLALKFTGNTTPDQGLPEVIVLSERILDYPDHLTILGRTYEHSRTLGMTHAVQDMAAYTLRSAAASYTFTTLVRSFSFKRQRLSETWLVVAKQAFRVACVHLTSDYVKTNDSEASTVRTELVRFANQNHIQAILGDFNLNTFSVHGGVIPTSSEFVKEGEQTRHKSMFATSNGGANKLYMGGIFCNARVFVRPTLSSFGNLAVPPWFVESDKIDQKYGITDRSQFEDKVFSDHPSIYYNYMYPAAR